MGILQSTYAIGWAFSTGAYLILFDAFNDDQAWRYLFLLGILPAARRLLHPPHRPGTG